MPPVHQSYPNIVKGARKLQTSAMFMAFFGWLLIIMGIVGPIVAGGLLAQRTQHPESLILPLVGIGAMLMVPGLWLLSMVVWYRMMAEIALAHRDIAINSFRTANALTTPTT